VSKTVGFTVSGCVSESLPELPVSSIFLLNVLFHSELIDLSERDSVSLLKLKPLLVISVSSQHAPANQEADINPQTQLDASSAGYKVPAASAPSSSSLSSAASSTLEHL